MIIAKSHVIITVVLPLQSCDYCGRSCDQISQSFAENCKAIVGLAGKYRERGVVGVDIAGDELLPLDPRHVAGFKEAQRLGLNITVHAAESGPASNVKQVSMTTRGCTSICSLDLTD